MGNFTPESLDKFHELCAEGVDFGEGPVYDFARCLKGDKVYGVSPNEVCRQGKPIGDKEVKGNKNLEGDARLSQLKIAFRKKFGRDLSPEEMKKAKGLLSKVKVEKKDKEPGAL
jgi:hypothetical protein